LTNIQFDMKSRSVPLISRQYKIDVGLNCGYSTAEIDMLGRAS